MYIHDADLPSWQVVMKKTNPKHLSTSPAKKESKGVAGNFYDLLMNAMGDVSKTQNNADGLIQRMITGDKKVDIHTVTNAISQAELAMRFLKSVTDRTVTAFRELQNMR